MDTAKTIAISSIFDQEMMPMQRKMIRCDDAGSDHKGLVPASNQRTNKNYDNKQSEYCDYIDEVRI